MYSIKSIEVYVFFFINIILYFAPLSGQLSESYYHKKCPCLEDIVKNEIKNATLSDKRLPASLLRLHFHDCFVHGCDASVLLDDTKSVKQEQSVPPNAHSLRGFEVIDRIKEKVEARCPNTVSCADILALAARDAVTLSTKKCENLWNATLGRIDGKISNKTATNEIPSPFDKLDTLITKMNAKGLTANDLVALSGAHTIGFAQCFTFSWARLYNFSGIRNFADPSMNTTLLSSLEVMCQKGHRYDRDVATLDWKSEFDFDNHYFVNLVNNASVLQSDQALMSTKETARKVGIYAHDQKQFFVDFGKSMVKMGKIGVVMPGDNNGEIRKNCGFINK